MRAGREIILGQKSASQLGVDSKESEIISGDEFSLQVFRSALEAHAGGNLTVRRERLKHLAAVSQVSIIRIGKRIVFAPLRVFAVKTHDAIRISHRQRAQEKRIDETED